MRRITRFAAFLLIAFLTVLLSCASPEQRASRITDEIYSLYWGDWEKVIEKANEAITIKDDYAWPYYQRGAAHAALEQYEEAIKDFDTATKLNPELEYAYTDSAVVHLKMANFEEAEIDLNAALSLNPADPLTLITMVELKSAQNQPGIACNYLRKAVNNGFSDFTYMQLNENFKSLLKDDCFREFVSGNP